MSETTDKEMEIVIDKIDELPTEARYFAREVLKNQKHVPIVAMLYWDDEPFSFSNFDWDGGRYEFCIVLDNGPRKKVIKQEIEVIKAANRTDKKFYHSDPYYRNIGHIEATLDEMLEAKDTTSWFHLLGWSWYKGRLVFARRKWFEHLKKKEKEKKEPKREDNSNNIGIGAPVFLGKDEQYNPSVWLDYATFWYDLGRIAYNAGKYGHSAYLLRMSVETSIKTVIVKVWQERYKQIMPEEEFRYKIQRLKNNLRKSLVFLEKDLNYSLKKDFHSLIDKVLWNDTDFRYPDNKRLPTKQDIETTFLPVAEEFLNWAKECVYGIESLD